MRSSSLRRPHAARSLLALFIFAIATYSFTPSNAASPPPGAPVVTSFILTQQSQTIWRLSGTVTASDGLEGLILYFGGSIVDEQDEPNPNGSFFVDLALQPLEGDWVEVYAIDRWGMQSGTAEAYF